MSDRDDHFNLGVEYALAGRQPHKFQDRYLQERFDRGYLVAQTEKLDQGYCVDDKFTGRFLEEMRIRTYNRYNRERLS